MHCSTFGTEPSQQSYEFLENMHRIKISDYKGEIEEKRGNTGNKQPNHSTNLSNCCRKFELQIHMIKQNENAPLLKKTE
jgi:hypothetical protein